METYAARALQEYNTIAVRPGGVNGNPFWNMNATQFTFVPSFYFPTLPSETATEFLFTATDETGGTHTFTAEKTSALLTPIWSEIPTGLVRLTVEALDHDGNPTYLLGARTFFKCAPFPGRENLPDRSRSYKEAAYLAFRYVFEQPMVKHWLGHGKPDPEFPHNVYPAKTISSVIRAMLAFARLSPKNAEQARNIAKRAADYMISITYGEQSALCGLPPTYSFNDMNVEKVNKIAPAAEDYKDTVMMIYPATAGMAYLELFEATGDQKYFAAAERIANYYNLTHINADHMIHYMIQNKSDDPAMVETAVELMHFVEDQFVVWGEYAPWIKAKCPEVRSPAGLEQYFCYWPIDGSTSAIMKAFLEVYSVTKDPLYFEKAAALGDMLTRMQNPETGVIPTFWTSKENIEELENFWINCHIGSAFSLFCLAEQAGEIESSDKSRECLF